MDDWGNDGRYSMAQNFTAGAVAGLIADSVMHPFDTVSHRAKVHPSSTYGSITGAFRLIYAQEGFRGYLAGLSATLVQSPPATAFYFAAYEFAKAVGLRATGGQHEDTVVFLAGAASEVCASLVFVPLEVVKARLQLGANPHRATGGIIADLTNYPNVMAALKGIHAQHGFRGLTSGWKSGFLQDLAFSATQFLVYERLKRRAVRRLQTERDAGREAAAAAAAAAGAAGSGSSSGSSSGSGSGGGVLSSSTSSSAAGRRDGSRLAVAASGVQQQQQQHQQQQQQQREQVRLGTSDTLFAGCVSGGVAAALTNPFDVITSRLMVSAGTAGYGSSTMGGVLRATLKEGPFALWKGTLPRVAQTAPLAAISFTVFEAVRSALADSGWMALSRSDGGNPFSQQR